jgi:hypothetical protein
VLKKRVRKKRRDNKIAPEKKKRQNKRLNCSSNSSALVENMMNTKATRQVLKICNFIASKRMNIVFHNECTFLHDM